VPPPFPPYDPKTQWRVYREQQKAAWRAQRDAWKAQRQAQHYAWKASCVGAYGPRVPSVVGPIILIGVGVIALLLLTGHINSGQFWSWYGHWWPLLLIGAGLALLAEWAMDLHRETPVRRGGSYVGILILLALLGLGAAGWNHAQPWFHWNGDGDEFFNAFNLPEHDSDQPLLSQQIPANAAIQIENPRGDVNITAGDGSAIEVQAHEVAYASSDAEAKKVFDAVAAHLTASGSSVLVQTESNSSGRVNLTITVPKTAKVTVNAGRGDVTAASLGAGISVTARGDVQLNTIAGSVDAHFPHGHHDISAHDIQGDVSIDGDLSDITLSEIKGKVTQSGEILLGGAHMESIRGPVHMHTSVTDVDLAELPGDLTLDSDDLRVNEAKGQVRVVTHSKDIDLNQVYGDSYVETRNGRISVEPAGAYSVDAKNNKGDIEVTLPPNASATVNVRTHNGDIVSDYAIPATAGENKLATFTIGSGASRIVLSASNGDVRIKKGTGFPSAPAAPSPAAPNPPKGPMLNVPPYHRVPPGFEGKQLKEPKVPPAPPVKQ
jgi:DUF4097 and DUF4098 domain-containing protein YvlB